MIEGLVQRGGYFRRTPKRGFNPLGRAEARSRFPLIEGILATFFIAAAITFIAARQWVSLPFISLFLGGYIYVLFEALQERLSGSRLAL